MDRSSLLTLSSKLYHLEPKGNGTPQNESLTGLISRLASAHRITTGQLINYEIVPVIQKIYLKNIALFGGTRFYNGASMINSTGQTAVDFVKALHHLTLRNDLLDCTMYPWSHVIILGRSFPKFWP